jgi:hypothetical protein
MQLIMEPLYYLDNNKTLTVFKKRSHTARFDLVHLHALCIYEYILGLLSEFFVRAFANV